MKDVRIATDLFMGKSVLRRQLFLAFCSSIIQGISWKKFELRGDRNAGGERERNQQDKTSQVLHRIDVQILVPDLASLKSHHLLIDPSNEVRIEPRRFSWIIEFSLGHSHFDFLEN